MRSQLNKNRGAQRYWKENYAGSMWKGQVCGGFKGLAWPFKEATQGFPDQLRPCGTYFHHPQGPDVRLPKVVTLRRGNAAARVVIGPLTKTRRRNKTGHDCVESTVRSLRCVNVELLLSHILN